MRRIKKNAATLLLLFLAHLQAKNMRKFDDIMLLFLFFLKSKIKIGCFRTIAHKTAFVGNIPVYVASNYAKEKTP